MTAETLAFWNSHLHVCLSILTACAMVGLFLCFMWWTLNPRGLWAYLRRALDRR